MMVGARGGERWRSSTDGHGRPSRLLHRQSRTRWTPPSFASKHIQEPPVSCATTDLGAARRRRRRSSCVQTHLCCSIAGSHLIFFNDLLHPSDGKKGDKDGDIDIKDCVLHSELKVMLDEIKATIAEGAKATNKTLNVLTRSMCSLTERMDAVEKRHPEPAEGDAPANDVKNNDNNDTHDGHNEEEKFEDNDAGDDEIELQQ
ncbi:hypothetical protein U9M48_025004 [Paspalum notatum var. saurae]|uniref:Uncharacterized protein n=1 Tax=Paspalum notatum var. saurae TaxID=547442 RepID=A0AAQ3TPF9_PASNO